MIDFTLKNAKKNQIFCSFSFAFFKKNYTIIFTKKLNKKCKDFDKTFD
jgi:hypothetical protein